MKPVRRERKSPFIQPFEPPQGHGICPGFYKLTPGIGCPYSCSYCYLDKTLRSMKPGGGPRRYEVYTNFDSKGWEEIFYWFVNPYNDGQVLNVGETLDSMATPEIATELWAVIMALESEITEEARKNKTLLLLTKSTNIPDCDPSPNVVLSWSINTSLAAELYEGGAPSPLRRLVAAGNAKKAGWRVRIRRDPIMDSVSDGNIKWFAEKMEWLQPERITLGTLRMGGKPRLSIEARIKIYREHMFSLMGICPIGLCKETPDVYAALGMSTEDIKCNCTP